jgi:hypothetical protein
MKKVILTTMAIVISLATVLSITGLAMARTEPMPEKVVVERIGLTINAPATAKAGQPLRIQVVTNPGGRPVPGAEVWGVNVNSLASDAAVTSDVASLSQSKGFLLGSTSDNGYVEPPPRIWREGKYILVAIKPNFTPGFAMMKVTQSVQLTLRAPDSAPVRQPVPMRVTDSDGQGVYRAAIFAVPLLSTTDGSITNSNYEQLLREAEAYAQMLEQPTADSNLSTDEEPANSTLNIRRYLIGFTDRNGDFSYRFQQVGPYLLIAAKCGYTPDFRIIKITELEPLPAEPAPMSVKEIAEVAISLKK